MRLLAIALILTACTTPQPMIEAAHRTASAKASDAPRLIVVHPPASASKPGRNLFAFIAAPVIVHRTIVPVEAAVAPVVAQPHETVVVAQTIEFPYRYVGRFGPDASPFAVFVREGEVVDARVGDAIGGFRLERIGIESVDVVAAAGVVRRISL